MQPIHSATATQPAGDGDYGPLRDEGDFEVMLDALTRAFAIPRDEYPAWLERVGRENMRVVRDQGRAVGGLGLLPMGQWFGGRAVSMAGVSAVCIAAEHRGRGFARRLIQEAVREMRARGFALSALYPATQPLYRSAGYEHAGARYEVSVSCRALDLHEHSQIVRKALPEDEPALRAAYRENASRSPGWLDRGECVWRGVRDSRGEKRDGFVVGTSEHIDGYIFLAHRPTSGGHHDLSCSDLVARDARTARRLLTFVADHRSMAGTFFWNAAPSNPWLLLLPEQSYKLALVHHWMLRILHVKAALEARGYPAGLTATLDLEVQDELLEENARRWTLDVADGVGRVTAGGAGELSLDVRGLAALYSGHLSAEALRAAGLATGTQEALAHASAVFSGPAPTLPDMF